VTGELGHLIASYGYAAVFAVVALESFGIPLPGETMLITLNVVIARARAARARLAGD
jgi:membrane protein DedA with SNARE-associated domain